MSIGSTLADHLSLFGSLPDVDREALAGLEGEVRRLDKHSDIYREGDQPTHVVVVLRGLVYRYRIGVDGTRQILSFYLPTEAPCLESLYVDYMDNNVGAVVDSVIGLIPHEQVYRVLDQYPDARKLTWRQTLVQGAIFREWLLRNSNFPANSALAHLVCEMFTRAKAAGLVENDSFHLPLTQEFIANALGITAVHMNRTLQLLREGQTFEWRSGRLHIRDFEKLAEIGDFRPDYLHLRR